MVSFCRMIAGSAEGLRIWLKYGAQCSARQSRAAACWKTAVCGRLPCVSQTRSGMDPQPCPHVSDYGSKPSAHMQNMLVTFQVDPSLIYGGSDEPAALVDLRYAAGGECHCLTQHLEQTESMHALQQQHASIRHVVSSNDQQLHLRLLCCRFWQGHSCKADQDHFRHPEGQARGAK